MSIGKFGCVECSTWSRCRKNTVYVIETYEDGVRPYQVWMADLHECPKCCRQIVCGFGTKAISVEYMSDFQSYLDRATITISGCPQSLDGEFDPNNRRITG
jgi:hypothetical protein